MNWTKFSLATLIGGVAYFFLGWLFYGILLKEAIATPANIQAVAVYPEEEFKIGLMALSCFAWSSVFVLIFMRWANISTFLGGLKAGVLLAGLITLAFNLGLAAEYKIWTMEKTVLEVGSNIVCGGLMAGLIGWFLGRKK